LTESWCLDNRPWPVCSIFDLLPPITCALLLRMRLEHQNPLTLFPSSLQKKVSLLVLHSCYIFHKYLWLNICTIKFRGLKVLHFVVVCLCFSFIKLFLDLSLLINFSLPEEQVCKVQKIFISHVFITVALT